MIFPLYPLEKGFEIWQIFTYMFMHGGLMHLFFNMFALWMFGMELENNWGSRKFLFYYLLCGLGAGLANLFIAPIFGTTAPTVGASGAVYGVLLAFGLLYPDRPIFLYLLLPVRAKYFVIGYMLLELYAGVTGTDDGIAHFAHLGGAAVGLIYLMLERYGYSFDKLFPRSGSHYVGGGKSTSNGYEYVSSENKEVSDANFYDIHDEENRINQSQIDEILDKINRNGYQSLTEEEKKILFEASKKLN